VLDSVWEEDALMKNKIDYARDQSRLFSSTTRNTILMPSDALIMILRLWHAPLRPLRATHGGVRSFAPSQDIFRPTRLISATRRTYAAKSAEDLDEEELKAARSWLTTFTPESIPKSICEVSFSRSSGPGGQNVNK
jgi:hypothetical protein